MTDPAQNDSVEPIPLKYLPLRKIVHIGGVVVPIIAVVFGKTYAISLVSYFMLMFLLMELLKTKVRIPAALRPLWKDNEYKGFATDPFLYFAFILLLLLLSFYFDEGICYASIVVLTVGDGISTVAGVRGKRYLRDSTKTIEGAVAGTIAATVIGFPFVGALALVGSMAGMLAEVTSKRFDNVTVPVAAFVSMVVVQAVIG
ncbi:MAG TPA: hypothetical protein C5S51_08790 [Methanosarcinaceae archaeon]|nr:hypothetical protein [Methanosarcinaceae archaeon]